MPEAALSRAIGSQDESTSQGSVLIIDDEAAIRESLQTLLEIEGYEVETATDGAEGLARLAERPFDLVLLDFALPERNGIEILQDIRERDSELTVIMITAYGTVENAVNAMQAGAPPSRRGRGRSSQARTQGTLQLRKHHWQERGHAAHI
jgi:CheY-like chemotaxis protein